VRQVLGDAGRWVRVAAARSRSAACAR